VLGLTFKEDVSDLRNSKVVDIVRELESYGFETQVTDPCAYAEEAAHEYGIPLVPEEKLRPAFGVVLAVAHARFKQGGWPLIRKLLVDGRGTVADVKNLLPRASKPDGVELWRL